MSWIESLRSANWNHASSICIFSYFLGCFTTGYYLVRLITGKDIRDLGSGSVGARNVGRILGKSGFFLTVLFDFGKGAFAVWLARHFTPYDGVLALAMLAVVAGHIWPVQLRFHGGKGMATSLGALVNFDFQLALTFVLVFLCLAALFRRTVLPGLIAIASVPLVAFWLGPNPVHVTFLSALAGLVIIAHRKNLVEEFAHFAERRHAHTNTDPS